jgi:hypothetical protein
MSTMGELSKWCAEAMLAPDLKEKWNLQGLAPVGSSSEEFAAHLRKQSEDYARVIREAGIKANRHCASGRSGSSDGIRHENVSAKTGAAG